MDSRIKRFGSHKRENHQMLFLNNEENLNKLVKFDFERIARRMIPYFGANSVFERIKT